jgi:hypothetical protein
MRLHVFAAAAVAVLVSAPALATPIISGKYILTVRKFCQPTFTIHNASTNSGAFVDQVTLGGSNISNTMSLVTFNPAKQNASFSGFTDEGDVARIQYTGVTNGSSGDPITESQESGKSAYSNSDTSVTFGTQTYNALYGGLDRNSVAHYVAFQAAYTNGGGLPCTEQGELSRQ